MKACEILEQIATLAAELADQKLQL